MIDWYDKNQCHHNDVNGHDRTNGRIFKVSFGDPRHVAVNLARETSEALVALQSSPNEWHARHARRILQERGPNAEVSANARASCVKRLAAIPRSRFASCSHSMPWAACAIPRRSSKPSLTRDPAIRAWTIQLATEQGPPPAPILAKFAELARTDPSPMVRLYLASAMQRLPLEKRWDTLTALVGHGEDASDHNLPLMYWYAAEPLVGRGRSAGCRPGGELADLAAPGIHGAANRRAGNARVARSPGRRAGPCRRIGPASHALDRDRGSAARSPPGGDARSLARCLQDPGLRPRRERSLASGRPRRELRRPGRARIIAARARRLEGRRPAIAAQAMAALLKVKDPSLVGVLHNLVRHPQLGGPAVRGLSAYDDPATPEILIKAYPSLGPAERRDVLSTLASRKTACRDLLAAVEAGKVPRGDLTADLVRQIRNLKDTELTAQLGRVWGTVRETSGDRARLIAQAKAMLTGKHHQPPDRSLGRAVYAKVCQQCHTLFGVGGQVGPDLTGSNRADLDYLLSNVLDPSALIGKDYQAHVIATTDGRVLTGIIRAEDKDSITLVTANETITLPKNEIEARRTSEQSMMPEDLWKPLSQFEIRSLVSYLASPAQVPLPGPTRREAH